MEIKQTSVPVSLIVPAGIAVLIVAWIAFSVIFEPTFEEALAGRDASLLKLRDAYLTGDTYRIQGAIDGYDRSKHSYLVALDSACAKDDFRDANGARCANVTRWLGCHKTETETLRKVERVRSGKAQMDECINTHAFIVAAKESNCGTMDGYALSDANIEKIGEYCLTL